MIDFSLVHGMAPSITVPLWKVLDERPITNVGVARIPFIAASDLLILTIFLICVLSLLHFSSFAEVVPAAAAAMARGPLHARQFCWLNMPE